MKNKWQSGWLRGAREGGFAASSTASGSHWRKRRWGPGHAPSLKCDSHMTSIAIVRYAHKGKAACRHAEPGDELDHTHHHSPE